MRPPLRLAFIQLAVVALGVMLLPVMAQAELTPPAGQGTVSDDKWHAKPLSPGQGVPDLNLKVVNFAIENLGKKVGNGECWTLAKEALVAAAAQPPAEYVFGRELLGKEPWLPGDILQFTSVKFVEIAPHRRTTRELGSPNHTAIIYTVNDRLVEVLQQNINNDKRVQTEVLNFATMVSGTIKAYRPIPRDGSWLQPGQDYVPRENAAGALPQYSSPQGAQQYSIPQGAPQYSIPQGAPQYSIPQGAPQYSIPQGASQYSIPQGAPQYSIPQGAPQYSIPQGAPQYSIPQGAPQYSIPQGAPQYSSPQGAPQYSAPQGAPQYSSPQGIPPYSGPQATPQYWTPQSAPQYSGSQVSPQYSGSQGTPQYSVPQVAPQYSGSRSAQ